METGAFMFKYNKLYIILSSIFMILCIAPYLSLVFFFDNPVVYQIVTLNIDPSISLIMTLFYGILGLIFALLSKGNSRILLLIFNVISLLVAAFIILLSMGFKTP
jgi:hypothetical protein